MYEQSDEDDLDEENNDPNTSQLNASRRSSSPTKKLVIPKEFFECVGDLVGKNGSQYKCLFPGCAKKKDQSDKLLVVSHTTRHNAKRHFLNHDPKHELGHVKLWDDAIKKLTAEDKSTSSRSTFISTKRNEIVTQEDLDNWVLDFIIVDVLPISIVEKQGFKKLVSSLAPTLILHGRTFFTNKLEKEYKERRQQLRDALGKCTDAATTIDAWTCRRRSYLGETIHWFEADSLKRKSACLAIRRIKGRHTYDVLTTLIEDLHTEYEIVEKLRGSTTDSGSNFLKAFRESGEASSVPNYEDHEYEEEEEEEDMTYFVIGEIINARITEHNGSNNHNPTLPLHRKCACHLLSLVAKADVLKIQDPGFQHLRNSTLEKLQLLWNKQTSSSLNADIIKQHLDQLLVLKNDTRWNSEYYAMNCIVRLLRKKNRAMRKLFEELKVTHLTPNEEQFLKEYSRIMRHIAAALDALQGEKKIGLGFLLPTISELRGKLQKLKDDASITHCQAMITGLLDAIHFRFQSMFSDNELRLATITNPFFKLSWMVNDDDIRRAKTLLKGEFIRFQGLNDDSLSSDDSSDGTSSSFSDPSPEKKRKHTKSFFSSITKRNAKTIEIDEVESYLQFCKNFEDLKNFPTIMKMYKRYNVTLPSSAAVERLFSQGGLIFTPKRLQLTDNHFEMLLFLKVNNKMSNKW